MTDRTVKVVLLARIEQWTRAMNAAGKDVSKVGTATEKTSAKADKALKNVGKSAQTNGKAMALGLTAAAYGAYKLVQSASDLNETTSKMGVVFGKSTGQVEKWASNAAVAMGISTQAAEESAATFGNLFVSMGLLPKKAADMSTSIVQLGADLASFNNTDPAQAIDALRSGLIGESEPLRQFGVNLNEAGIKAEAMKQGLYNGTGQISASAKAQAAYSLILQQTGTAQGDVAKTSDGVANSTRRVAAQFEDAKAAIGQQLLPAFNGLLHTGSGVLKFFNGLPGPVQTSVAVLGGLAVAAKVVGPAMLSMRTSILEAKVAQAALAVSTVESTVALEAQGTAAVASGSKMGVFAGKAGGALLAVSVLANAPVGHTIMDAMDKKLSDLAASQGPDVAKAKFEEMAAKFHKSGDELQKFSEQLPLYAASQKSANVETGAGASATSQLVTQQSLLAAALKAAKDGLAADITTIEGKKRATYAAADADAVARTAIADLGKAHHVTASQVHEVASQIFDAADAQVAAGGSSNAYRGELVKLRDATKKGSPLRKELDGFIADLDKAAKSRTSTLTLNIQAYTNIAQAKKNQLKDLGIVPKRATGGPVVGPGSGTSDSVPILASNGEFVMTAATTNRIGVATLSAMNAGAPLSRVTATSGQLVPLGARASTLMPGASDLIAAARALVSAADQMQERIQGPPPVSVHIAGREVATAVRDQTLRDQRRG